jgi:hypothetical protein
MRREGDRTSSSLAVGGRSLYVPKTILGASMLIILLAAVSTAQQMPDGDLALTARASASSESEGTKTENLPDGNISNTGGLRRRGRHQPTPGWN